MVHSDFVDRHLPMLVFCHGYTWLCVFCVQIFVMCKVVVKSNVSRCFFGGEGRDFSNVKLVYMLLL